MIENIERIIKVFESAKITKLDLEFDNIKIKLEKNEEKILIDNNAAKEIMKAEASSPAKIEGTVIKSPVVGTYYAQKSAGEIPFISVGQKVKKGDTLCIIEAMKVMNEIKAPCDGVIKDIMVENEDLVEFDEAIIVIGE